MRNGVSQPGAATGFTTVELMVTITIFAILVTIAVPSFRDASLGSQLRAMSNSLAASAALARSEAIKRNKSVTMCASADGLTCDGSSWDSGWIVTRAGELIQHEPAISTGFRIVESGGVSSLSFAAVGLGATPATLTVCRATPTPGTQGRLVTLDTSGRAWVKTLASMSSCP
jgi:type IV fimbrial biogenesis protein FimT